MKGKENLLIEEIDLLLIVEYLTLMRTYIDRVVKL